MPLDKQINLEELLERLGANEVPIDLKHRHALRRVLLNCSFFESHKVTLKWSRMFSYAGTALAGGMAVTIVVVSLQIVFAFSPVGTEGASSASFVKESAAGPTIATTVNALVEKETEIVESPFETLDFSTLPRVMPANVMNFVDTDFNLLPIAQN